MAALPVLVLTDNVTPTKFLHLLGTKQPMDSEQDPTPFVAIGGLGGSGTRVVAQIVQKMGFYLGPVLNPQLDNLLFTLLFKRRDWIAAFPQDSEVNCMIGTFAIAMRDGVAQAFEKLAPGELERLLESSRGLGVNDAHFQSLLTSRPQNPDMFSGLAWKEPNTHVFLAQLMRRLPNLKYIHVIRNGLDMALSGNRQQLMNWGGHYGIQADAMDPSPNAQLQFWLAANRQTIEISKGMRSDQFLLLNYDELCQSFKSEVQNLQTFLDRRLSNSDMAYITSFVKPNSIGRFREAPADTFSTAEVEAVQQFGFSV